PRYIEAKRAHNLALAGRQSLMDYRGILNKTAGLRATSPLGKLIAEGKGQGGIDIVGNGKLGTGDNYGMSYDENGNNIVATPEEIENVGNNRTADERTAYERAINKGSRDAQARNTLLRAENLDKTRNSINVEDLTRYSGLKGTGKYLYESAQAAAGKPSQDFLAHNQAVNAAALMADQMRQFYGDSIQP